MQEIHPVELGQKFAIQRTALTFMRKTLLARESPRAFVETVGRDDHGNALSLEPMHRQWFRHVDYCWERRLRCMILAHFGAGKTSSLVVPMIAHLVGLDTNVRIKVVTNDDASAAKRANAAKRIIESPEYRRVFPNVVKGDRWTDHEIFVTRWGVSVEPTVHARGVFTTGIGGRCVLPGVWIHCPGGPRPIEEIVAGDRVLGSSGKYEIVERTSSREYAGEVLDLGIEGVPRSVSLTPEHRVRVFRDGGFSWVRADEIVPRDLVLIPRSRSCSTHKISSNSQRQKDYEKLIGDDGVWRIFGYYLGDGWCKNPVATGKRGSSNSAWFAFNNAKDGAFADDIIKTAERIGATWTRKPRGNVLEVRVCHRRLIELLRLFGTKCLKKRIPAWAERASRGHVREMLRGFHAADGYTVDGCIGFTGANEHLMFQTQQAVMSLGIEAYIGVCRKRGAVGEFRGKQHISAGLWMVISKDPEAFYLLGEIPPERASEFSRRRRQWVLPDAVLLPVRTIAKRNYSGPVYDLTVPATGDFATVGALVHNCDYLFIDDVVDQKNSTDPAQRKRVLDLCEQTWFSRLEPDGNILWIATSWHQQDASHVLMQRKGWCTLIQRVSQDCTEIEQEVLGAYDGLYPTMG